MSASKYLVSVDVDCANNSRIKSDFCRKQTHEFDNVQSAVNYLDSILSNSRIRMFRYACMRNRNIDFLAICASNDEEQVVYYVDVKKRLIATSWDGNIPILDLWMPVGYDFVYAVIAHPFMSDYVKRMTKSNKKVVDIVYIP